MNNQEIRKHLIRIPIMMVLDCISFVLASLMDAFLLPQTADGSGHPFPYFTVTVALIMIVATIVVFLWSIFNIIRLLIKGNKKFEHKVKDRINPLLPISFSLIISIILVFALGSYEINTFYNNPDHIGFAIPAGSFFLAGILFIVNIVIAVISIVLYKRK